MTIISHITVPLIIAASANIYYTRKQKSAGFKGKHLVLIGLCGGLPDILSPHIGINARYNSFTHSLWFMILALLGTFILAWKLTGFRKLIFLCFFAVCLHLVCDMVSGGINIFAPFGAMIIGKYYLHFRYWFTLDIINLLVLSILLIYRNVIAHKMPTDRST